MCYVCGVKGKGPRPRHAQAGEGAGAEGAAPGAQHLLSPPLHLLPSPGLQPVGSRAVAGTRPHSLLVFANSGLPA